MAKVLKDQYGDLILDDYGDTGEETKQSTSGTAKAGQLKGK